MSEARSTYRLREILEVARSPIEMRDEENYMLASIRRRNGGMFDRETKKGNEILTKTLSRVIPGSFVISKMQVVHGACGMAPHDFGDRCISASYVSLLPREPQRIDIGYLDAYATTKQSYDAFIKASHGVHIEKMTFSLEDWLNGEIELPPLPEQKKIAEILSGIDSVIKTELDMASKITMQYQGILHDVFSDESSCFPLGNYLPLEELGLDISDGNYSSKYPSANEFVERGIPFIRASNMKQGTIDDNDMRFISREKHQEITKGHLKSGDILIANRGEIGKACRVPARHRGSNINAQLVRINGGKKIDQSFLYHYISSPLCQALIDELTTGTALKQLPIGNLMKLPIPVPELNVQTAIGGSLDSMQRAISALSDKSKKYSQLKQAMASDLLSGRKRVTL